MLFQIRGKLIMSKAQSSMEFVILLSFMIFVFLLFFIIIEGKIVSLTTEKLDLEAQDVLTLVTDEVRIAESVSDSYYRQFILPGNIKGLDYNISFSAISGGGTELIITYYEREKIRFFEGTLSNDSTIWPGSNNITKINGIIRIVRS
jgi:hypothetical protein